MFVAINRITAPAGAAEHLERAFAHAGNLQGIPGFAGFQFLRSTRAGDPLEYLAITHWETRAAFDAWTKSESFRQAHQGAGGSGMPAARLETYETVD
ncbi:MAG: antibiotic biosynthesis monooxygenase family protein [Chloroflexota bacterium]